jgi:hypothetical protein
VDHVPGSRHQDELAPGRYLLQSAGLAIAIDNFITASGHDRDRQRQFEGCFAKAAAPGIISAASAALARI